MRADATTDIAARRSRRNGPTLRDGTPPPVEPQRSRPPYRPRPWTRVDLLTANQVVRYCLVAGHVPDDLAFSDAPHPDARSGGPRRPPGRLASEVAVVEWRAQCPPSEPSAASSGRARPRSVRAGSPVQSGKDDVAHYRATYQFDGRGWICQFVDPDIATFGRTLAAAKAHARSMLAVYLEVDDLVAAGVDIEDEIRLPAGIDVEIDDLARQRKEAETLRREVAAATRSAAAKLRAAGLSTRDVGDLIGVSGARVGQLENRRPRIGEPPSR